VEVQMQLPNGSSFTKILGMLEFLFYCLEFVCFNEPIVINVILILFKLLPQIDIVFAFDTWFICLESNASQPFIVKTNENQWEESEGILLKMETFGDALETSWCQFANTLQKRYLAATKQDIQKPTRPLSVQDINYLYQLKFASNILSLSLSLSLSLK
jgi:hypothetical protein